MSYFVTGGTGFIGRFLIERLARRKGTIYVLVRRSSKQKYLDLLEKTGLKIDDIDLVKSTSRSINRCFVISDNIYYGQL